jgi:hypothetical protein
MSEDWSPEQDAVELESLRDTPHAHAHLLEERVVKTLRAEGLLVSTARMRWLTAAKVGGLAAVLALTFTLGVLVGSQRSEAPSELMAPIEVETMPGDLMATALHDDAQDALGEALTTAFHEDLAAEHPLLTADESGYEQDNLGFLGKPVVR